MDIMTLVGSAKAIFDLAKEAKVIADAASEQTLKAKVFEIMEAALEAKEQALSLRQELLEKDEEIADLKKTLQDRTATSFKNGMWYKEGDDVPFCPTCYEKDEKLIHLIYSEGVKSQGLFPTEPAKHFCRVCSFQKKLR